MANRIPPTGVEKSSNAELEYQKRTGSLDQERLTTNGLQNRILALTRLIMSSLVKLTKGWTIPERNQG